MIPYNVYYFDSHQMFLGMRSLSFPGRNERAIRKLVLDEYWSVPNLGNIQPAYAMAMPLRSDVSPVLVVKENG